MINSLLLSDIYLDAKQIKMFIEFHYKPISMLSDVVESALNLFTDVIIKPVICAYDEAAAMTKFSKTKSK